MKLNYCFYLIGGKVYCKNCSLEMISDISEFKIVIEGGKTYSK